MKAVVRTLSEANVFLRGLSDKFTGKPMSLEVKPFKQPRTLPQNAKAHAMMNELANHVGHSAEEIKQYLKAEYADKKTIQIGATIIDVPMGTSEMTAEQMSVFVEHIYEVGAMCDCKFNEY